MAKYKVGDKVRVRSDLVVNKDYKMENGITDTFVYGMESKKGKIVIITSMAHDKYTIAGDSHYWTDEMFEPVESADTTTEREDKNMATFRIKNVKTIDKKVVIVEFSGGDVQKAVCMPEDTFDFEKGIEVCVMKHLLGKAGYYKALKDAEKQIKALKENTDKKKADAEAKKRKEAKTAKYKARKAERKRAARVAEMKEAYLAALYEYNGDAEKAVEAVK